MTVFGSLRSAAIAPVLVAALAGLGFAQTPVGGEGGVVEVPTDPASRAPKACTPGRCVHRTTIGRYRCKRHLQEAVLGFPEEFERPPLGAMVYAANRAQVRNGEAASMVLYRYDFDGETSRLNVRGLEKLATIAGRLPIAFDPVVVETTGDVVLDDARRSAVFSTIGAGPFAIPIERVVIGSPSARGMRGEEAALIYDGSLSRIRQTGPFLPSFDRAGTASLRPR